MARKRKHPFFSDAPFTPRQKKEAAMRDRGAAMREKAAARRAAMKTPTLSDAPDARLLEDDPAAARDRDARITKYRERADSRSPLFKEEDNGDEG